MAGDELVRRLAVAMLAPALGQHVFLLRFQHREPPDFFQISCETAFGGDNRQCRSVGHRAPSNVCPRFPGRRSMPTLPEPTAHHVATANPDRRCSIRTKGGERKSHPRYGPLIWSHRQGLVSQELFAGAAASITGL